MSAPVRAGLTRTPTAASRRKTLTGQTLDNTTAAVATFDLDLNGLDPDTVVLLVAVIRADGPSAVPTATLQNLALNDAHERLTFSTIALYRARPSTETPKSPFGLWAGFGTNQRCANWPLVTKRVTAALEKTKSGAYTSPAATQNTSPGPMP